LPPLTSLRFQEWAERIEKTIGPALKTTWHVYGHITSAAFAFPRRGTLPLLRRHVHPNAPEWMQERRTGRSQYDPDAQVADVSVLRQPRLSVITAG